MFRRALGIAVAWAAVVYAQPVHGQACCAGAGAVTPGRLAVHEDALVGLQVRVANVFGSFDRERTYRAAPADTTEWDFEQNFFGALRVSRRGQLALLVPAVQTYRRTGAARASNAFMHSEFGGGLGDVNFSGRYDFVLAGESFYIPGIAVLAGVTFPTGTSVESAEQPLATDATGVGAFQGNLGLAFEQTFGPWLFGLTGLVAKRSSRGEGRTRTTPGTQLNAMFATAYTFPNDVALAMLLSYTLEGAPVVNGEERSEMSRQIPRFGFAGIYPLTDQWRLQGGLFVTPPISGLGRNTPSYTDLVFTVLRSWS